MKDYLECESIYFRVRVCGIYAEYAEGGGVNVMLRRFDDWYE